jgi:restriction endonuclease S subunit
MAKFQPLSSISTIRAGVQFRKEVPYCASGSLRHLQVRDEKGSLTLEDHEIRSLADGALKTVDFLKLGDVVIRAKGKHHPAVLIQAELTKTVASAYCLVVTPVNVLPVFLAWYLNQVPAQQYMDQFAAGSVLPVLNKKALGEMQVPLPNIKTQEHISQIFTLQLQEERIARKLQRLYQLQNQCINQSIINAIEN